MLLRGEMRGTSGPYYTGIVRPGDGAYPTIEADRNMIEDSDPLIESAKTIEG